MTAFDEIKKAFPNMFRPLKWHYFDGQTEHGCGEWYANATRVMYHIYDVREKFPNDRPFYAKELSDQFDTLEQAKDAVQNRHELDIVMCLDPDFCSTLESLQRENEELTQDRDRTARNRDMYKGQVERQADSLSKLREEEIRLRETLFKCGRFIADRFQEGDPEYQVVLLVNDAIFSKPALASTGGEHHAE